MTDAIKDRQIMTDKSGCITIVIKAIMTSVYAYSGCRCSVDHHTQDLDNDFPPYPWLRKASLLYCKDRSTPHQVTKELDEESGPEHMSKCIQICHKDLDYIIETNAYSISPTSSGK